MSSVGAGNSTRVNFRRLKQKTRRTWSGGFWSSFCEPAVGLLTIPRRYRPDTSPPACRRHAS